MAQNSGFFDSLLVNGVYDRTYSAADYCDNLATVIKNGVRYSADDDLKVTAGNGMALTVGIGRAWINGHFYHNDAAFTDLTIGTAPTGSNKRIDAVVLRLDTSVAYRNIALAIKQGTAAAAPVAPAMTRSGDIYELCLATVEVVAGATSITADKITDTRANGTVCGWASSVTPAIMSMLRKYEWVQTLETAGNTVTFDIPQYDAADVHILEVYTNGFLDTLGADYTISGRTITFAMSKQAGAEIKVILYKSIDGTGLETAAQLIEAMQAQLAGLASMNDFIYECNGVNDNVLLSNMIQAFLNGGTDYGARRIRVHGNFGVSAPAGGEGTSANPYMWIKAGAGSATNRTITLDFTNCGQINIAAAAGTYNIVFYGLQANVIGANVVATGGAAMYMFSTAAATAVNAENCRFWITSAAGYIARGGTFKDCRTSVTLTGENAWGFNVLSGGLLRIFGGEHYAYAATGFEAGVVYVNSAQTNAVAITYGMNCPAVTRSGYVQTYAVNCLSNNATCSFTDTVTTLTMTAPGQNIRGTIARSKADLM